jgi:hypothetical protein
MLAMKKGDSCAPVRKLDAMDFHFPSTADNNRCN